MRTHSDSVLKDPQKPKLTFGESRFFVGAVAVAVDVASRNCCPFHIGLLARTLRHAPLGKDQAGRRKTDRGKYSVWEKRRVGGSESDARKKRRRRRSNRRAVRKLCADAKDRGTRRGYVQRYVAGLVNIWLIKNGCEGFVECFGSAA